MKSKFHSFARSLRTKSLQRLLLIPSSLLTVCIVLIEALVLWFTQLLRSSKNKVGIPIGLWCWGQIFGTIMALQQPSQEKKQKLSTTLNKTQLLLQDYTTVRQTVRDILALLQKYGPLTAGQIEYNLPKVPSTIWGIPDVLNILSSMEILGLTESHTYTWNGGITRADTVLPTDVMSKIVTALQEAEASWKRSEMLKQAVLKKTNPKDVLKQLLDECPDIVNDPVYLTALKACDIDLKGKIKKDTKPSPAASPRVVPGAAAASPRVVSGATAASPRVAGTVASPRVVPGTSTTPLVVAPTAAATTTTTTTQGSTVKPPQTANNAPKAPP